MIDGCDEDEARHHCRDGRPKNWMELDAEDEEAELELAEAI